MAIDTTGKWLIGSEPTDIQGFLEAYTEEEFLPHSRQSLELTDQITLAAMAEVRGGRPAALKFLLPIQSRQTLQLPPLI